MYWAPQKSIVVDHKGIRVLGFSLSKYAQNTSKNAGLIGRSTWELGKIISRQPLAK